MNGTSHAESESYHVCIVGGGPVGIYMAMRLAQEGVNVCAFEARYQLPDQPRAFAHLPLLQKEFARAGILQRMKKVSVSIPGVTFRRRSDLQIVEKIKPKPDQPHTLGLPQKRFVEEVLLPKLSEYENGRVMFGQRVISIEDTGNDVQLEIEDVRSGLNRTVQCQYLVGADGSRSMVREIMGVRYEGTTLPYKLIAADVMFPFESLGFEGGNFLLDGEHFGAINFYRKTPEGQTVWRVSTTFPITMTDAEVLDDIPRKLPHLIKDLQPGRYEILQVTPYKARQSCTTTMLKGRMMLIGDSAHLVNPYSGQLLASGMLAASSLADCLAAVLRRGAPITLLEEWNEARLASFWNILHPLSMKCIAAVGNADVETIGDRHPFLLMRKRGPSAGPPPSLETDATKLKSWLSLPNGDSTKVNGIGLNGVNVTAMDGINGKAMNDGNGAAMNGVDAIGKNSMNGIAINTIEL